jgi:circadian clock protein KaiC
MKIERIESGIPGFDQMTEGGFVKGSTNLIAGPTGTGKTIFCCQYLLHGLKKGENGVYISLEQNTDDIMADVSRFGWHEEFKKYIGKKKLILQHEFPAGIEKLADSITNSIESINAKRFVLDSLSIATMGWEDENDVGRLRKEIFDLITKLKRLDVTTLLITEVPEESGKSLSRFGFEEFLADSVVVLHYLEYASAGTPRSLLLRKMRRTDHKTDIMPMKIGKNGIQILSSKKKLIL